MKKGRVIEDALRAHLEALKELPPDLSGREAYFRWGWEAHNRINAKLGKPEVSLEEARWRWPA